MERLMLDNTVNFKCVLSYQLIAQFDMVQNDKLIGEIFCFGTDENEEDITINTTWIFFDEYTDEELIYFIQGREGEIIDVVEKNVDNKGFWDYPVRVIVNKEIRSLEDLGNTY